MPTQRFIHLSEDKQKRIIEASINEFARVPFEKVSINRIIQDAGISRGSFYQYFEDKRDLQEFMLEDFKKQLGGEVKDYLDEKRGDLFQFFEDALSEVVRVGMQSQFKSVCKNVFSRMKYGVACQEDGVFTKEGQKLFEMIIHTMKDEYYAEYTVEELTLVWEILIQLIKEALVRIFLFEEEEELIIDRYRKKVALIEAGMKAKKHAV